jgi:hypothetical protein
MTTKPEFVMAGLLIGIVLFNLAVNRYLDWIEERRIDAEEADKARRRKRQQARSS